MLALLILFQELQKLGGGAGFNYPSGGTGGTGGSGGGGTGGSGGHINGYNATYYGSGGGANGYNSSSGNGTGGNGYQGIVIISYATDGSDGITTDSTGGTITTSGDQTIHTFTSDGTFTAVISTSRRIFVIG